MYFITDESVWLLQLASPENSRGAPPMPKHAPSRRITPMALVRPQQQGAAEPAAQEWKQE